MYTDTKIIPAYAAVTATTLLRILSQYFEMWFTVGIMLYYLWEVRPLCGPVKFLYKKLGKPFLTESTQSHVDTRWDFLQNVALLYWVSLCALRLHLTGTKLPISNRPRPEEHKSTWSGVSTHIECITIYTMMSYLDKVLCFFLFSSIYLMMKGNLTPSCDRITSAIMPGNVTYDYSVVITTLVHEYSLLMGHTTPLRKLAFIYI